MALDCVQRHTVSIYDRGGRTKLWELSDVAEVRWGRRRDDISEASIFLTGASCDAQNSTLSQIRSSRHEVVIHRGDERVWEGPITRLAGTRNTFEIHAKDVMHYAARTTMRSAYNTSYPAVTYTVNRAYVILNNELSRKEALDPPINVVPYLTPYVEVGDAQSTAATVAYQYQVWEHIDELAAKSGMDYTVVGRAIHMWDTHRMAMGQTAPVTQADFLGDITVTEYGMELATHYHATDGRGSYGSAGANDAYYGQVELLATVWDETSADASPSSAIMTTQAERNLSGRMPTPVGVRLPANSGLNPNGVLSITDLVPGVWIPLRAEVIGFKLVQWQKLDDMSVIETAQGETVSVTMSPAPITETEEA